MLMIQQTQYEEQAAEGEPMEAKHGPQPQPQQLQLDDQPMEVDQLLAAPMEVEHLPAGREQNLQQDWLDFPDYLPSTAELQQQNLQPLQNFAWPSYLPSLTEVAQQQ